MRALPHYTENGDDTLAANLWRYALSTCNRSTTSVKSWHRKSRREVTSRAPCTCLNACIARWLDSTNNCSKTAQHYSCNSAITNNCDPFTLRTAPYVDARTWTYDAVRLCTAPYVHMRQCTATYGTVRRRRTLQMLNYILLTIVVNGHNCVRRRTATQHTMPHKSSRAWLQACCVRRRTATQCV